MTIRLPLFLVWAAALALQPVSAKTKLSLSGSSTVAPLAAEIGKRFEKLNPEVQVDVQSGGSSRGVNDSRTGLVDIGMASRALKPEERDLVSSSIALDGIGIIIHSSNPVKNLSNAQIVDIYTGKIRNWQDVGGKNAPITVISKAEGRSTLELFVQHFKLKPEEIKASVVIGDNEQGIKTLAGNPDAIGYVSIGSAEYAIEDGVKLKLLPMNGIAATTENVKNGQFPLSRPLNLITKTAPTGMAKTFIDFAQSPACTDLVREFNFVPLRAKTTP